MNDYDNTNRGVLFKNDKGDNPNRPDYTGRIDVDGTERWLSAWIKEGKKGKFMSLSVGDVCGETSTGSGAQQSQPKQQESSFDNFDDDIPFN